MYIEDLKKEEKCSLCSGPIKTKYFPMETWKINGILCGNCYSKKISEYYPGEHVRVDLSDK
jgi:hypothetical protein